MFFLSIWSKIKILKCNVITNVLYSCAQDKQYILMGLLKRGSSEVFQSWRDRRRRLEFIIKEVLLS